MKSAALQCTRHESNRYRLANQQVPLQPGLKYELHGWVKTDKVAGQESGATLCVEWSDKQGKWLGGAYPSGVKGTADWTQITGVAQVPDDAGSCTLSCYLRKGMTGTAWFDDMDVRRVIEPPLSSVLISPVDRGQIMAAGPETIKVIARLNLRDISVSLADLSIHASLQTVSDNRLCASVNRKPIIHDNVVEPTTIELSSTELAPGSYRLRIALVDSDAHVIQIDRTFLDSIGR